MKKRILLLTLLLSVLLALGACGKNSDNIVVNGTQDTSLQETEAVTTAYQKFDFDSVAESPAEDFETRIIGSGDAQMITIAAYLGDDTIVKIPSKIDGITVSMLNNEIFRNSNVTYVYIPDSVSTLGTSTFLECHNLKQVRLPENITYIPMDTFLDCESLEYVNIPDGVTGFGDGSFYGCKSLKQIDFPSELEEIGYHAFLYSMIETVDLSKSLKIEYIGDSAFGECPSLKSVIFPTVFNVKDLHNIFSECTNLRTFSVADNDNGIAVVDNVLYNGTKLLFGAPANPIKNITVKEGTTEINKFAFHYSNIESVKIPDSCKEIDQKAFKECRNLKNVDFGNGIETISHSSFEGCDSLETVVLPASLNYLGDGTFYSCDSLKRVTINSPFLTSDSVEMASVFKFSYDVVVNFSGKDYAYDQLNEMDAVIYNS